MSQRIDHWNYRVLRTTHQIGDTDQTEDTCEMIEVFYDAAGNIVAWSETLPGGDSPSALTIDLDRMLKVAQLATLKSKKHRALTPDDLPGPRP